MECVDDRSRILVKDVGSFGIGLLACVEETRARLVARRAVVIVDQLRLEFL